jgi:valyl-tRNA synthetase
VDQEVERSMSFVQRVIETIRGIRGEMGIPPSTEIPLLLKLGQRVQEEEFRRYEGYVARLARVSAIRTIGRDERPRLSASSVVDGEELFIPLEGIIDIERERTRLRKELDRVQSMVTGLTAKLSNPDFLERAPVEVVGKEREKLATFSETLGKLRKNYDALES